MSALLEWREARAADRSELPNFCCTEDATKRRVGRGERYEIDHPRIWELKVQSKIRSLTPPYRGSVAMLLGCDSEGIAAVAVVEELDGPATVELCQMAISRRLRGRGGGYADEMLARSLDHITARAVEEGIDEVEVFGYVHPQNHACQAACRRVGFRHLRDMTPELQQWGRELPISVG